MARFLLVRHGETDWNVARRMQGQLDPPLNERGLGQAQAVAAVLAQEQAAVWASSDLQRAQQTAAAIAHHNPACHFRTDVRLREVMLGDWQGRLTAEIAAEQGERFSQWEADATLSTPPNGEPATAFAARVQAVLADLTAEVGDGGTAVVVTHGGWINAALCVAFGLPLSYLRSFGVGNCSLTELYLFPNQRPVLMRLNGR